MMNGTTSHRLPPSRPGSQRFTRRLITMAMTAATMVSPGAASDLGAQQQRGPFQAGANRVAFPSEGATLAGTLHLPASYQPGQRLPMIVVAGTWTSVKEQMAERYAERMAGAGFAALAFDFRGFGESAGEPRQYESPERKIADIANAARFAGSLPIADGGVGGLAICASAGYMAHAIARGAPLEAFATVAAWLHDPGTVGQVYGGDEGVARRVAIGRDARAAFDRTGRVEYVPAESPTDPSAAMVGVAFYEDPARGAIPQWENRFAVMSWAEWLTFDALAPAPGITVPTLLVHSDQSALPDNVRRFHAALAGPKELFWTEGQHTDFYDRDPYVATAVRAVAAHFRRALGGSGSRGDTER